jgi:hypothetical protein
LSGYWVVAFYVAATVVGLYRFLRLGDRRLLPLVGVFALQAAAHAQTDWFVARRWHLAAGACGLLLLGVLSWRRPA